MRLTEVYEKIKPQQGVWKERRSTDSVTDTTVIMTGCMQIPNNEETIGVVYVKDGTVCICSYQEFDKLYFDATK